MKMEHLIKLSIRNERRERNRIQIIQPTPGYKGPESRTYITRYIDEIEKTDKHHLKGHIHQPTIPTNKTKYWIATMTHKIVTTTGDERTTTKQYRKITLHG
jgi:hypothetical protein